MPNLSKSYFGSAEHYNLKNGRFSDNDRFISTGDVVTMIVWRLRAAFSIKDYAGSTPRCQTGLSSHSYGGIRRILDFWTDHCFVRMVTCNCKSSQMLVVVRRSSVSYLSLNFTQI